jgi:hypothetical protein
MRHRLQPGRRRAVLALMAWPLAAGALARGSVPPPELAHALPGAALIGEATLRWLGLQVYDIRLWAEGAQALQRPEATRLALELQYARALDGGRIAERSLQEMQGIGTVAPSQGERWLQAMRTLFPDVGRGDRITGLQLPGEAARFWLNGQPRGEVRDAEFTRLFFGIWLSPRTSQPKLRAALLGAKLEAS